MTNQPTTNSHPFLATKINRFLFGIFVILVFVGNCKFLLNGHDADFIQKTLFWSSSILFFFVYGFIECVFVYASLLRDWNNASFRGSRIQFYIWFLLTIGLMSFSILSTGPAFINDIRFFKDRSLDKISSATLRSDGTFRNYALPWEEYRNIYFYDYEHVEITQYTPNDVSYVTSVLVLFKSDSRNPADYLDMTPKGKSEEDIHRDLKQACYNAAMNTLRPMAHGTTPDEFALRLKDIKDEPALRAPYSAFHSVHYTWLSCKMVLPPSK